MSSPSSCHAVVWKSSVGWRARATISCAVSAMRSACRALIMYACVPQGIASGATASIRYDQSSLPDDSLAGCHSLQGGMCTGNVRVLVDVHFIWISFEFEREMNVQQVYPLASAQAYLD